MDYHSMKRAELQALCKEHNIPANSTNSVMADKLSELFNEKQKPKTRQRTCMKSSVETVDESESAVSRRKAKKVRFSPNNDLVEYELRSGKKEEAMVTGTKHRRKSVVNKVAKPVVDNVDTELIDDGVQIPAKLTRSRVQQLRKDGVNIVNEKKQGRRAVKDIEKGTDAVKEHKGNIGKVTRSKVHTLGKAGLVQLDENKQNKRGVKDVEKAGESEETVVGRVRVTRSKAQTLMEDGMGSDLNPQVKKKSGSRLAKKVENVELSKEIMDVPVRVTRSRGQTLKDDIANVVANPQAKKKINRKETKVSDLSNNLSNVTSENNQQLPNRKSSRTRGVEIAIEDGGEKLGHGKRKKRREESTADVSESQYHADKGSRRSRRNESKVEDSAVVNHNDSKVDMVDDRKVTRSKASLNKKPSGGNNTSKAKNKNKVEVQRESKMVPQLEEPLGHAGRKNVNRRKSVMQPENTEVVLHHEEPVNRPARKDARRRSVMQKAQGKGIDEPLVGKRQSKEQFGNLSMINEGSVDKENVTRSGKDASENEMKAVASVTGSHKSKKRRGNPINEDQTIETVYVSSVDESPRCFTRTASKSEGKAVSDNFVAKKQQQSSLKTPASRLDTQSAVGSAFLEGHQGEQSDLEDHSEKLNTEGATVSKVANFELDEKVIGTDRTPAIDESRRRFTRSAIRSERNAVGSFLGKVDRKEPSRSDINTTPGRLTRSGIKHRGNVGSKLFEKVTVQKTKHADTIGVQSDISEEAKGQILKNSGELSVSESVRLPTKVMEENRASMSEAAIVMENVSLAFEENASNGPNATARVLGEVTEVACGAKVETSATPNLTENLLSGKQQSPMDLPSFEDETPSGTNFSDIKRKPFSMPEVAESTPDVQNQNQNQKVHVTSATFNEAEVQVAVNSEKSVLKSARSDANGEEMDPARSVSRSTTLQTDVMVEEPVVSVGKTVVKEQSVDISLEAISKGNDGDTDNNCDSIFYEAGPSAVCHASFEQSDVKGKSKEMEAPVEPSIVEGVEQFIADDGAYAQIEKGSEQDASTCYDSCQNPSAGKHEVADHGEHDDEDMRANAHKQLMNEPGFEENRVHGSIDILQSPDMGSRGVADGVEAQEMDSVWEPSTSKDACQTPVVEEYDVEHNGDDTLEKSTSDDMLQGLAMDGNDITDDMVTTWDSLAEQRELSTGENVTYDVEHNEDDNLEQSTGDDVLQGLAMDENDIKDDMVIARDSLAEQRELSTGENVTYDVEHNGDDTLEQSTGDDMLHGLAMDENDTKDDMVTTRGSLAEQRELSTGENVTYDVEHNEDDNLEQSTGDDMLQGLAMDENDIKDDMVTARDSLAEQRELSTGENVTYDVEHNGDDTLEQSTGDDMLHGLAMDENDTKDDMVTTWDSLAEQRELSTGENVTYGLAMDRCDDTNDGVDSGKESVNELEFEVVPSTGNDVFQISTLGKSDGEDGSVNAIKRCETDLMPSTASNKLEDTMLRSVDGEGEGVNADKEHESNSKPLTDNDVSDASLMGKDDDFNMTRELEPISEPSTTNDILETLFSGKGIGGGECDNASDDLKSYQKPASGDDASGTPVMGNDDVEDDGINLPKELEPCLVPSNVKNTPEVPFSGNDAVSECVADDKTYGQDGESVQEQLTSNDSPAMDEHINVPKELEPCLEPSTAKNILEVPVSGNDVVGECVVDHKTDGQDGESEQEQLTSNDSPAMDEHINVPKELEPCLEPSNAKNILEVPVSGNDVVSECVVDHKSDGQDGESEQERLTSNDSPAMDEQDVGGDGTELPQNENIPVVPEVLIKPSDQEAEPMLNIAVDKVPCDTIDVCASVGQSDSSTRIETPQTPATSGDDVTVKRVDALEESILDINKDDVSNNLDGLGNAIGVMDTENDISFCGNEQKIIATSELDEGGRSKESESVSPGMSNEQRIEEAETITENDHTLADEKEHTVATVDHDLDNDKFMEDCSNDGVDESDSQLVGNIKTPKNPSREESSPVMSTKAELSDSLMEDIRVHESPAIEENLPVTYKKESPLDTISDPHTSSKDDDRNKQEETQNARTYVDLGNYNFGIDEFQKPVSANESDDVLSKSMKDDQVSDLQTSARASSCMEESSSPAADLVNSVTNLEKTFRKLDDGKLNQDVFMMNPNANADVTEEFSSWSESSMKALFRTPTTTRTSNTKNALEDAGSFTFPDDRGDDDVGITGTAAHDFGPQWESEPSRVFNDQSQGTATRSTGLGEDPQHEVFGVSNFEEFSYRYFDDEVGGSSGMSAKNNHSEFKGDQVDQIKQNDLSKEVAGTSYNDASGLKEEKETQLKG